MKYRKGLNSLTIPEIKTDGYKFFSKNPCALIIGFILELKGVLPLWRTPRMLLFFVSTLVSWIFVHIYYFDNQGTKLKMDAPLKILTTPLMINYEHSLVWIMQLLIYSGLRLMADICCCLNNCHNSKYKCSPSSSICHHSSPESRSRLYRGIYLSSDASSLHSTIKYK